MRKILQLIICCVSTFSFAQDASFSQFYANRIYLNPALTGLESGLSLSGVYRLQWKNVDSGFKTYAASVEIQEPFIRSGIGLTLFQDVEGLMELKTSYIGLSYAYTIPMEKHNIHFGMQARWVQKSVDWTKIIYSDQLDPVYGNVYASAAAGGMERVNFTDFDFGGLWRFNSDLKIGKKRFKDTHNSIGFSIHHAPYLFRKTGGIESLQNLETVVAPRLTLHAGSIIPAFFFNGTKKKISISPNFKYDVQGYNFLKGRESIQVFTYGAFVIYESVYLGAMYQNKYPFSGIKQTNAFILAMGLNIDPGKKSKSKYFIGFSYDANTTGVGTRAGGVYEIAFRWNMADGPTIFGRKMGSSGKKPLDCYDFF